ncbi:hypothetical protein HY933_04130 [Candidatus Falkowbacteria bacterium]|nr:hypothetical protein [Candidatus Falkowbacteria bacterium]
MFNQSPATAVLTTTKTATAMKVLLAVTVVTASLAAISAFAMSVAGGLSPVKGLSVFLNSDPSSQTFTTAVTQAPVIGLTVRPLGTPSVVIDRVAFSLNGSLPISKISNPVLKVSDGRSFAGVVDSYNRQLVFDNDIFLTTQRNFKVQIDVAALTQTESLNLSINPRGQIVILRPLGMRALQNQNYIGPTMTFTPPLPPPAIPPGLEVRKAGDVGGQLVAGRTHSVTSYMFIALNEPVAVTKLWIAVKGANAAVNVKKIYLFRDSSPIGLATGYVLDQNGKVLVQLPPDAFVASTTYPYPKLNIKVELVDKTQLIDGSMLEIGLGDSDGDGSEWGANGNPGAGSYLMEATGVNSGVLVVATTIDSFGDGNGSIAGSSVYYLMDGVLRVSLNSASPRGSATPGVNKEVLTLTLIADNDDITVDNLEFTVVGSCRITGTGPVTIKGDDSTTYATLPAGQAWLRPGSRFDVTNFGTWNNQLVIPRLMSKTLHIFGDTTGCSSGTLQMNVKGGGKTISGVIWQNNSGNQVDSTLTRSLPIFGGALSYGGGFGYGY